MKRNLYDIFDHFEPTEEQLPKLTEQPIDEKAVADRVYEQLGCRPVLQQTKKKKRPYRLLGIAAAAAVLTCGTITTAAVNGNLDLFFATVSSSDLANNSNGASTSCVPEDIAQMQQYYTCPDVSFTTTDGGTVSLLGLYHDHNTLMFSIQLTVQNGTTLQDDDALLPYFTLTAADGTTQTLSESGYLSQTLQKSTTSDHIYYATYYLVDRDFSGSTLNIDFAGVYTQEQAEQVQNAIITLQEEWQETYEDMSIDDWKALWKENGFDQQTEAAQKDAFAEQTAVLAGHWTADIPISECTATTITANAEGMQLTLDDLSFSLTTPSDAIKKNGSYSPVIYLKDGTILSDDFFMFDDVTLTDDGYQLDGTSYRELAYVQGTADGSAIIYCYDQPIDPSEIEKVELYVQSYDDQWNEQTDCYTLYQAE